MSDESTPASTEDDPVLEARPNAPPPGPGRVWTRLMLVGGGLLAAWGALVSAGVTFILVTGDPGPGGAVPLVIGGLVIGVSPVAFGGILLATGLKRWRATRASDSD
jgi:hypothetical protein